MLTAFVRLADWSETGEGGEFLISFRDRSKPWALGRMTGDRAVKEREACLTRA